MLKPIFLENNKLLTHPFRPEDLQRLEQLTQDIFSILSDDHALKFIPGKRLQSLEEAASFLRTMVIHYHAGLNYIHFITDKKLSKVVGIIGLIVPKVTKAHYQIDHYLFSLSFI